MRSASAVFKLGLIGRPKSEYFEQDDVYVSLIDDPIFSSVESMMSFMSDHVDQWFVVLMFIFVTTTKVVEEF